MPTHSRSMRWLLRGGFLLALALTLFFAVRTVVSAVYWSDPANHDQPMQGWMPLGYVARSWDVPRGVLGEALSFAPDGTPRRNLDMIAAQEGVPLSELIVRLTAAITTFREGHHD